MRSQRFMEGATLSDGSEDEADYDPWQPFERMFAFNHGVLDRYLIKPAATGGRKWHRRLRGGVLARFFDNLDMPRRGLTRLLLGKLAARFVVGVVQMIVLLAWAHFVFGVSLGTSPVGFLLLTAASLFAVVAAGILVGGLARSREQILPLGPSLVMALSALGGSGGHSRCSRSG